MPRARVVARNASARLVQDLINGRTLFDAAAAHPTARPLEGRGVAYAVAPEGEAWLVRHYRRGGAVASALGDRYARWAPNRALHELHVSEAARARGVPTPQVVAAVTYDAGLFRRFDLAVDFIAGASDLSDALFAGDIIENARRAAAAIRALCAAGIRHADLNLKNILVDAQGAWIIDLDRAELVAAFNAQHADAMRRRFVRSLEKWQQHRNAAVPAEARAILEKAFHG